MRHVYLYNYLYILSQKLIKLTNLIFKSAYLLAAQQASNSRPKNGPTPLQLNEIGPRTLNHAKTLQDRLYEVFLIKGIDCMP